MALEDTGGLTAFDMQITDTPVPVPASIFLLGIGYRQKKEKNEHKVKLLLEEQITTDQDSATDLSDSLSCDKHTAKLQKQADKIDKWLAQNKAKIGE